MSPSSLAHPGLHTLTSTAPPLTPTFAASHVLHEDSSWPCSQPQSTMYFPTPRLLLRPSTSRGCLRLLLAQLQPPGHAVSSSRSSLLPSLLDVCPADQHPDSRLLVLIGWLQHDSCIRSEVDKVLLLVPWAGQWVPQSWKQPHPPGVGPRPGGNVALVLFSPLTASRILMSAQRGYKSD